MDASDLIVQVVGSASLGTTSSTWSAKAPAIRRIDRFDSRSPHCNKIAGALRLAQDAPDGVAVLTDADTAILDDPRRIERPHASLSAKTVDSALPPLGGPHPDLQDCRCPDPAGSRAAPGTRPAHPARQLQRGHVPSRRSAPPSGGGRLGHVGSMAPRSRWSCSRIGRSTSTRWRWRSSWPLRRSNGIRSTSAGTPRRTTRALIPPDGPRPHVLHYHWEVDHNGLIKPVGKASIDAQIEIANAAITHAFNAAAPSATLRRWRAEIGVGARQERRPETLRSHRSLHHWSFRGFWKSLSLDEP